MVLILTSAHKQTRKTICENLLSRYFTSDDKVFLHRIITGDEWWINDITGRRRYMLICFFGIGGIVHMEFVSKEQTVDDAFYKEVLERLIKAAKDKGKESFILHHDNATFHKDSTIKKILLELKIEKLEHPSRSADLAPCDFFLFPTIKEAVAAKIDLGTTAVMFEKMVEEILKNISIEEFQNCFKDWPIRWKACVITGGRKVPLTLRKGTRNRVERVLLCEKLWHKSQTDEAFLNHIITGDCLVIKKKCRFFCFFNASGIVYKEFVPKRQALNPLFYIQVLDRFLNALGDKRKNYLIISQEYLIPKDPVVKKYMMEHNIEELKLRSLSPTHFFLLLKFKSGCFGLTRNAAEEYTEETLNQIKVEEFQECFKEWQQRWKACIDVGGKNFSQ